MARLLVLLLVLGVAYACVSSQATPCGDLLCPAGRVCARGTMCVDQQLQLACNGRPEGATCNLPEFGDGVCQEGLCIVGTCGDGKLNGIEACDGSDLGGKDCTAFQSPEPGDLRCGSNCMFDFSGCNGVCGDHVKSATEECDGSDFGDQSCGSNSFMTFYGGTLSCNVDCTINYATCSGYCGDQMKNGLNEQCDGSDVGNLTCATLPAPHLGSGVTPLHCGTDCSFTPDSCTCGAAIGGYCDPGHPCNIVGGVPTCQ